MDQCTTMDFVHLFNINFLQAARKPVPSDLNITNWCRYLVNYDLSILCEYLHYGLPLNVNYEQFKPVTKVTNHASALRNLEAVDKHFAD